MFFLFYCVRPSTKQAQTSFCTIFLLFNHMIENNVNNTSYDWFIVVDIGHLIVEDTSHLIVGVSDIHWVIVAQITCLCSFIVSCKSASPILYFLVAFSRKLNIQNIVQCCMSCCDFFVPSKSEPQTFNGCVTQRDS